MVDSIINCNKCGLCKHQLPLLDDERECKVFWVGLSAKKITLENEKPLSPSTNSGSIIKCIEEHCRDIEMYKTNLVKCLPLDETGRLRYPNNNEIHLCLPNLNSEIFELSPQIIILLGNKVIEAVGHYYSIHFDKWDGFNYKITKYKNMYFIPVHHPSYVYVYKRQNIDEYVNKIESIIEQLIHIDN